jgi:hypothetical protein
MMKRKVTEETTTENQTWGSDLKVHRNNKQQQMAMISKQTTESQRRAD